MEKFDARQENSRVVDMSKTIFGTATPQPLVLAFAAFLFWQGPFHLSEKENVPAKVIRYQIASSIVKDDSYWKKHYDFSVINDEKKPTTPHIHIQ